MDSSTRNEKTTLRFLGYLKGHNGEVTSMVTGHPSSDGSDERIFISAARDKKILIWKLNAGDSGHGEAGQDQTYGQPFISFTGHSHFISDLALNKENSHLISSSWDKTLRLWDVKNGKCTAQFIGANSEVTSVTITSDSRKIFSAGLSSDMTLWNIKGKCMDISKEKNHTDWISKIRYSPSLKNEYLASVGWDGKLKIWINSFQCKTSLTAHDSPINALAISTNGMFIATGGRDQLVKIWKMNSFQEPFQTVKCSSVVNDVAFSPQLKIFAVATNNGVYTYNMESLMKDPSSSVTFDDKNKDKSKYSSIAWSSNGNTLFCGRGSGVIEVYAFENK